MASVNDYGGPTNSLATVPLGGVGGWAEAVAAALDNRDTTVDARIANHVGQADPHAQYVEKTGDTMTGPLTIVQAGSTAADARLKVDSGGAGGIGTIRYVSPTSGFIFDIDGGSGSPTERPVVAFGEPTASTHGATKGYVDGRVGGWQDWTNTRVDQGTSTNRTHTVQYARYCRIGDLMHVIAAITFTEAGSNGSAIILTNLPNVLSTIMGKNVCLGTYDYIRSGLHHHTGAVQIATGANCYFRSDGAAAIGQSPAFAIAVGDLLTVNLTYPAA